jgi:general secretion pathway protein G
MTRPSRIPASRRARGGFTLIEMLVVIAAIVVLAAIILPNLIRSAGTSERAEARAQIEVLESALEAYRLDNGAYPTTAQGLAALWEEPTLEPRPTNWLGPYMRTMVPLDPWGNPYVYLSPGEVNERGYDIISYGADGQPGGEGEYADVTSY